MSCIEIGKNKDSSSFLINKFGLCFSKLLLLKFSMDSNPLQCLSLGTFSTKTHFCPNFNPSLCNSFSSFVLTIVSNLIPFGRAISLKWQKWLCMLSKGIQNDLLSACGNIIITNLYLLVGINIYI